jgi:endonuclease/exonuclease/phosphatase (EEP) superfamily protein YafD
MKTLKIIFQIIGLIAALMSLIPLIAADYWWIRFFDFPHIHFTLLTFLAIVLYFFTFNYKYMNDYLYITILLGCFTFQLSKFIDYTPVWGKDVLDSSNQVSQNKTLKIYTVNVLQKNSAFAKAIKDIMDQNPDIIVFTETDATWSAQIEGAIGSRYDYKLKQAQDNTYGMLLYSKLELSQEKVLFKVDPEIPSMHTRVKMKDGDEFLLMAIHPTPPAPTHNPSSTDRDTEMMKTAIKSFQSEMPVVVIGDFNDVPWSRSTELVKTIGKLLDPRVGRGFYNTFNAKNPIMRWPLDHILITSEFRLKEIGTGDNVGSDHFPYYCTLTYEPKRSSEQEPDEPSKSDWERAKDQMSKQGMQDLESIPDALNEMVE